MIKEIANGLLKGKSVAIFCHVRPDGDTLGSATALKLSLIKKGIKAEVFSSDKVPEKFFFLEEMKNVKNDITEKYDAYIAIDNADALRLGKFYETFISEKNTFNVDHHLSNLYYAKYNYVCEKASNAENTIDLIDALDVEIDKETANLLALGIITDTGNFKHKNVTPDTMIYASRMLKCGADFNFITYKTFNEQSKERAKLFGKVMSKIRYFMDDKIAIATVRLSDLKESGAKQEETEGFIDFVMGINTVEVGACVMETEPNKFKISFRSKKADVNEVAKLFGGGGHVLASGCQISGEYEEVVDKLSFAISKFVEE